MLHSLALKVLDSNAVWMLLEVLDFCGQTWTDSSYIKNIHWLLSFSFIHSFHTSTWYIVFIFLKTVKIYNTGNFLNNLSSFLSIAVRKKGSVLNEQKSIVISKFIASSAHWDSNFKGRWRWWRTAVGLRELIEIGFPSSYLCYVSHWCSRSGRLLAVRSSRREFLSQSRQRCESCPTVRRRYRPEAHP